MKVNEPGCFVLTMDTDWAPQYVIDHALDMVRGYGVPVTLFCTSAYDLPADIRLEAALHPNFMADSTQGGDEASRLANVKALYPQARGSRSHRLYWHSGLHRLLLEQGVTYDASIFYPLQPGLMAYDFLGLIRLPIWWADGFHLMRGLGLERFAPPGWEAPGIKVLNFHPIHIYCNTRDFLATRNALAGLDLHQAAPEDLSPARQKGPGVARLFEDALKLLSREGRTALAGDPRVCRPAS